MLPEKDLTVAQRVTELAQKLALLLTFLASQKELRGIESKISEIVLKMRQSWEI